MNPVERRLQRLLLDYACECELDGNGRLLLSAPLRQHAGLDKQIMLVGQLNKFEIWSETRWLQQVDEDIQALPDMDWTTSDKLRDFHFSTGDKTNGTYHCTVAGSGGRLAIRPDGVYVDGTFGRGGHSRLILQHLGPQWALVCY